MKIKIELIGMSCSHCVRAVEASLKSMDGVSSVKANLGDNSAIIEGEDFTELDIEKNIEKIGFEVRNINLI